MVMANKLAHYKDPEFIAFMREWFQAEFNGDWHKPNEAVYTLDLYQKYHEYTTPAELYDKRVDYALFVKCLRASGIIDIGGRWRLLEDPSILSPKSIHRLTADKH